MLRIEFILAKPTLDPPLLPFPVSPWNMCSSFTMKMLTGSRRVEWNPSSLLTRVPGKPPHWRNGSDDIAYFIHGVMKQCTDTAILENAIDRTLLSDLYKLETRVATS